MINILDLSYDELNKVIEGFGEKKFRTKQIYEWIHKKTIENFSEMNNVPIKLRNLLEENYTLNSMTIYDKKVSEIDNTTKYLFEIEKGNIIESAYMEYEYGSTVCVSTQAGCNMGCTFCASTIGGLNRNLTSGEMLAQVYRIQRDKQKRISNIVMMGSGEPLQNYDNSLLFIKTISNEKSLDIGSRHITLSTCGIVPKIYELAEEKMQITLAISLHAPNDKARNKIMPINKAYGIDELIEACNYYIAKTNRRITFEYALILGVNDTEEQARELASKLRKVKNNLCHINLIPLNEVDENDLKSSDKKSVERFKNCLESYNIATTIRRKRGKDVDGACGQLRNTIIKT